MRALDFVIRYLTVDARHLSSVVGSPSSAFEMRVPDPCAFLALCRWPRIEPAQHLFRRAPERLRNGIDAVAFAGHALRSHQLLQRPWRMRCSPAQPASCRVGHCGLPTIATPAFSNARSRHLHAPADRLAAGAAAPRLRPASPPTGPSRWRRRHRANGPAVFESGSYPRS
jgi:hypothetical protein